MTVTSIITGRTPRISVRLAFGQGRRTPATGRTLAVVAGKLAAGTGVANVVTSIASTTEAIAHFGQGSSGALMIDGIFNVDAKASVRAVVAADSTAAAASIDMILATPPTNAGLLHLRIGDTIIPVATTPLETIANIGAGIVAAYAGYPDSPGIVTFDGATKVTITSKDKGTAANICKWRMYDIPSAMTCTPSSGTFTTVPGVNELDWSAAYAALAASSEQIDIILPATNVTAAFTTATTGLRDRIVAVAVVR